MSEPILWLLVILAIAVSVTVGYFLGRGNADRKKVDELEKQLAEQNKALSQQQEEMERYRQEVHAHFDKTATLFVSMAGSYKALYEHLSEGYDKLADKSLQKMLPDRAAALLEETPATDPASKSDERSDPVVDIPEQADEQREKVVLAPEEADLTTAEPEQKPESSSQMDVPIDQSRKEDVPKDQSQTEDMPKDQSRTEKERKQHEQEEPADERLESASEDNKGSDKPSRP